MPYTINEKNGILLLKVSLNRATLDKATAFKNFTDSQIKDNGQKYIIDLSEVDFIDSTFLGVLVSTLKRIATSGGKLGLVIAKEEPLNILKLTRIDKVFRIFNTVEKAIKEI